MNKRPRSKQKSNAGLGGTIRQARLDAGLTQIQVAEKVGIESKYLSVIENGHGYPSFEKLSALIHVLKIDPQHVFGHRAQPKAELEKIIDLLSDLDEAQLKKVRATISALVTALK